MRWDLRSLAAITGGRCVGDGTVTSVSVDSRTVQAGGLFVAGPGERVDGHAYVRAAMDAGAAACLVSTGRLPDGVPGVEVAETIMALGQLASARRSELKMPVVAITGSSGKTTTKDFTAGAIGPGVHAARDSYNNEIGVPLTVLATPDHASAVVVEVGSRGRGHIEPLGRIVRPTISVITNIGPAHLEMFGDLETVAVSKWELVDALGDDGVAVLPDDLEPAGELPERVVRFGEGAAADVRVSDYDIDDMGRATVSITWDEQTARIRMPVPGRHQGRNAAAAVAVAVVLGRSVNDAASGVAGARVSRWRMEARPASLDGVPVVLVNDAYNANPASMAAALETVAEMPGRRIAVLGKMHELGSDEGALHAQMGELAAKLGFALVVVVGEDPGIASGAGAIASKVSDAAGALRMLSDRVEPGDVVLVKGSRAAGLEAVAAGFGEVVAA